MIWLICWFWFYHWQAFALISAQNLNMSMQYFIIDQTCHFSWKKQNISSSHTFLPKLAHYQTLWVASSGISLGSDQCIIHESMYDTSIDVYSSPSSHARTVHLMINTPLHMLTLNSVEAAINKPSSYCKISWIIN